MIVEKREKVENDWGRGRERFRAYNSNDLSLIICALLIIIMIQHKMVILLKFD